MTKKSVEEIRKERTAAFQAFLRTTDQAPPTLANQVRAKRKALNLDLPEEDFGIIVQRYARIKNGTQLLTPLDAVEFCVYWVGGRLPMQFLIELIDEHNEEKDLQSAFTLFGETGRALQEAMQAAAEEAEPAELPGPGSVSTEVEVSAGNQTPVSTTSSETDSAARVAEVQHDSRVALREIIPPVEPHFAARQETSSVSPVVGETSQKPKKGNRAVKRVTYNKKARQEAFVNLNKELNDAGFSDKEIYSKAGISGGQYYLVRRGKQGAADGFCEKLAKAAAKLLRRDEAEILAALKADGGAPVSNDQSTSKGAGRGGGRRGSSRRSAGTTRRGGRRKKTEQSSGSTAEGITLRPTDEQIDEFLADRTEDVVRMVSQDDDGEHITVASVLKVPKSEFLKWWADQL